jgi:hypothetical protein
MPDTAPTNEPSLTDFILKQGTSITEKVIESKLDEWQARQDARRNPPQVTLAAQPAPAPGLPKWVIPAAIAAAVFVLVLVLKKR